MNGTLGALARAGITACTVDAGTYYAGPDGALYVNIPAQPFEWGVGAWKGVPVLGFGGTATRFAHFGRPTAQAAPPEEPSKVLLLFVGGTRRPFAALDTYAAGTLVESTEDAERNTDRGAAICPADHGFVNGGGAIILDQYGRIALIAGNNPDIGAELGTGGVLRVSRGGNATGVPVLKSPWVTFEQSLRTQLNILLARVAALEAYVISSTPIPTPPAVDFPNPANAAVGAAAVRVPSTAE